MPGFLFPKPVNSLLSITQSESDFCHLYQKESAIHTVNFLNFSISFTFLICKVRGISQEKGKVVLDD